MSSCRQSHDCKTAVLHFVCLIRFRALVCFIWLWKWKVKRCLHLLQTKQCSLWRWTSRMCLPAAEFRSNSDIKREVQKQCCWVNVTAKSLMQDANFFSLVELASLIALIVDNLVLCFQNCVIGVGLGDVVEMSAFWDFLATESLPDDFMLPTGSNGTKLLCVCWGKRQCESQGNHRDGSIDKFYGVHTWRQSGGDVCVH